MTLAAAAERRTLWLGAVAVFLMAMTPLIGYLAPLGFAPLLGLVGLLAAPTLARSRPPLLPMFALLLLVAWAMVSLSWSPAAPALSALKRDKDVGAFTALKLVLQLGLYGSAAAALSTLSPRAVRVAGRVMLFGVFALALLTGVDAMLKAKIYQALRLAVHDPIRPDLAPVKVSLPIYPLALLFWPCARVLGAWGFRGRNVLIAVMAAMILAASHFTSADASGLAFVLAGLVWLGTRLIGKPFVRGMIPAVSALFVFAPLAVLWAVRSGVFAWLHQLAPPSWDARLNIWAFAANQIVEHPLRGWGVDASRIFGDAIPLHTHDAALQIWLELGAMGAALAAAFFAWVLYRIVAWTGADRRDGAMAAASLTAYVLIGALSFGVWQEWWLALGVIASIACGIAQKYSAASR